MNKEDFRYNYIFNEIKDIDISNIELLRYYLLKKYNYELPRKMVSDISKYQVSKYGQSLNYRNSTGVNKLYKSLSMEYNKSRKDCAKIWKKL